MSVSSWYKNFILCGLCSVAIACGTDTSSGKQSSANNGSGSSGVTITTPGGVPTVAQPKFSLQITDAPVDDVVKVVLTIIAVELLTENGSEPVNFAYTNPLTIDLLQLQGLATASLLDEVPVPAADYTEIRLLVDDAAMANYVELQTGGVQELNIPSGSSSGLKLKGDVSLSPGIDAAYTIDFDLRQSLVKAGNSGKYILKPVVRIIDNSSVGHISGTVDQSLLVAPSCSDSNVDSYNSAYVYAGHDVTPGDINQSSSRLNLPLATSNIEYRLLLGGIDSYIYEAAFLPAGNYTIAFTCNADADDLNSDNDLKFFGTTNVVVLVNNTTFL